MALTRKCTGVCKYNPAPFFQKAVYHLRCPVCIAKLKHFAHIPSQAPRGFDPCSQWNEGGCQAAYAVSVIMLFPQACRKVQIGNVPRPATQLQSKDPQQKCMPRCPRARRCTCTAHAVIDRITSSSGYIFSSTPDHHDPRIEEWNLCHLNSRRK